MWRFMYFDSIHYVQEIITTKRDPVKVELIERKNYTQGVIAYCRYIGKIVTVSDQNWFILILIRGN